MLMMRMRIVVVVVSVSVGMIDIRFGIHHDHLAVSSLRFLI